MDVSQPLLRKKSKKQKTKGKKPATEEAPVSNTPSAAREPKPKRVKKSSQAKPVDPLLADSSDDDETAAVATAVPAVTSVAKPMPKFSSVQDELDSSDDDEPTAIVTAIVTASDEMDEEEEVEQDEESDDDMPAADKPVADKPVAESDASSDQDDSDEEAAPPAHAKPAAVVNFDNDDNDDGDDLENNEAEETEPAVVLPADEHAHMSASINPDDHVGIPRKREARQDQVNATSAEAFVSIPNSVGKLAADVVLDSTCCGPPQSSRVSFPSLSAVFSLSPLSCRDRPQGPRLHRLYGLARLHCRERPVP